MDPCFVEPVSRFARPTCMPPASLALQLEPSRRQNSSGFHDVLSLRALAWRYDCHTVTGLHSSSIVPQQLLAVCGRSGRVASLTPGCGGSGSGHSVLMFARIGPSLQRPTLAHATARGEASMTVHSARTLCGALSCKCRVPLHPTATAGVNIAPGSSNGHKAASVPLQLHGGLGVESRVRGLDQAPQREC